MKYDPIKIENYWQNYWAKENTFAAENHSDKPKYYVLDMFPYPSGAGLHVGHPLGYIASDVVARFKRHQQFNVLHPMGYDSFGLPAEQYAIQTGQRPEDTTLVNIEGGFDKAGNEIQGYRKQLDKIGFSFDWSREVRTSNPDYYKWTQWIFIQLFNSWYNKSSDKAENIRTLSEKFQIEGNAKVNAVCDDNIPEFSAEQWKAYSKTQQEKILLKYRLTYLAETEVNWCPQLGTVLANDEIVNGVSERGGYPVVRKKMTQWSMRISAYAERLLQGLDKIDWTEALKESQRNWIGKSTGASVKFQVVGYETETVADPGDPVIEVFTTRPDTIFGVSFLTLAPEHPLVPQITTEEQKAEVDAYVQATAKRSERDRMSDVKTVSGAFTGAFAMHPLSGLPVPIWIGDYVLAGYGTGAVMSVPAGDQRDYDFAKHFNIPIENIFENQDISARAFTDKENICLINSDFLNGLDYKEATKKAIEALEEINMGKGKTNYRLRDAVFSRQRYWGEPFPVFYREGVPQMIDAQFLPIRLPEVEKYLPTEDGAPPLGNAKDWGWDTTKNKVVPNDKIDNLDVFPLELNTMPGWAGSSWYWLRYMDPHNENAFVSKDAENYWQDVDLYIGGSEHATGHLLYSRFWNKFLFDRGLVQQDEPFKKLINQGMILGMSAYVDIIELSFLNSSDNSLNGSAEYQAIISSDISDFYKRNAFDIRTYLGYPDRREHIEKQFNDKELKSLKFLLSEFQKLALKYGFDMPYPGMTYQVRRASLNIDLINQITNQLETQNFDKVLDFVKAKNIITEIDSTFKIDREVEKMSKSKYNVVNPDDICNEYGADTLRLYEMFLGPLEQAKPWNTAGITGVFGFLKKLWRLYFDDNGLIVTSNPASKESLKTLHKTIKKVQDDIESFSFNTSVSQFMICVNELTAQNCHERSILEPLAILISPYAPHIAEELWHRLGHDGSISNVPFPKFNGEHLLESSKEYPVSFNGKTKFFIELPLDLSKEQIEEIVIKDERTTAILGGNTPKKVIVVPGKIVNIVG